MNLTEAIEVLKDYQKWRMGADTKMAAPKKISEALKIAIRLLDQMATDKSINH